MIKRRKTALLVVMLLMAGLLSGCSRNPLANVHDEETLQVAVANHLADPYFSGHDFAKKFFGFDIDFRKYNIDEQKLYFVLPHRNLSEETLKVITKDPQSIEWGTSGKNGATFGRVPILGYQLLGSSGFYLPDSHYFRIKVTDLRIRRDWKLEYRFGDVVYDLTPDELAGFFLNQVLYNGYYEVETGRNGIRQVISISRAINIAKAGEPSLGRLADRIIGQAKSQEEKIQAILDFVVLRIDYSQSDNVTGVAVLKRPNEVLMVRGGNCANKAILFASLLEQVGEEYLILYMPNIRHATIAVAGRFPDANGLSFKYEGNTFFIAEPTIDTRFLIGQTVQNRLKVADIGFVQRAGGRFYSMREKKYLPFVGE